MERVELIILILLTLCLSCTLSKNDTDPGTSEYWYREGRLEIQRRLKHLSETFGKQAVNNIKAKNVIFFLGDGMGMSTITATRTLLSQLGKDDIYNPFLVFDRFPFVSLAKVNSFDSPVADSACSATAYLGGVKGNRRTIGVTGKVAYGDCKASLADENRVKPAFEWAQENGLLTGFVTTTRVSHATPAGLYAHSASRKWEAHAKSGCSDIATQLIRSETGKKIRVAFGGGKATLLPRCTESKKDCFSLRKDDVNLVQEWLNEKKEKGVSASFITTKSELLKLDPKKTDYVLGTFADEHLHYVDQKPNKSEEPTLEEMTVKALNLLSKDNSGYFLFVEGGLIDRAHHGNKAHLALTETIEFVKAIEAILSKVNLTETLIIVAADHSHSMTINGYSDKRGNLLTDYSEEEGNRSVWTTLMYGNGPGYKTKSLDGIGTPEYKYKSASYTKSAHHSGEDTPVFAIGAGASLFSGVYDHTFIAHAIRYILANEKRNTI